MKRIIVTILAILMVVSLFTACGGQQSADTIKIGINLELSGAAASYGEETLKGMEMAIEEINAAGGVSGTWSSRRSRAKCSQLTLGFRASGSSTGCTC